MSWDTCAPDEHFLFGTLTVRVSKRNTRQPAANVRLCVGVTEDEARKFRCKARHVTTDRQGICTLEFPIGKAVVAANAKNYKVAWVALDRETDVELEI